MVKSKWMNFLADFRKKNPNMSVPEAAKAASKLYKKHTVPSPSKEIGGSFGGGAKSKKGGSNNVPLTPDEFNPDPNYPTSGVALQLNATTYSGGAKKSRRSKSKSHRKARTHKKSRSHRG